MIVLLDIDWVDRDRERNCCGESSRDERAARKEDSQNPDITPICGVAQVSAYLVLDHRLLVKFDNVKAPICAKDSYRVNL